jgi:hypothetical protein
MNDETVALLEHEANALEQSFRAFVKAQTLVPLPSPAEIQEVRSGSRSMTRNEYILARLQRVIVTLENLASDLRLDLEHGFEPGPIDLLESDVNALEAAVSSKTASPSPAP